MLHILFGPPQPPATLLSPKTLNECLSELTRSVNSPWLPFGFKPVVGRAKRNKFVAWKRIWLGSSFQTEVIADLSKAPDGTLVQCRFGPSKLATGFMVVWMCALAMMAIGQTIGAAIMLRLGSTREASTYIDGAAICVGMIFFGFALCRFCIWLARYEREFLIEFLRKTLRARTMP